MTLTTSMTRSIAIFLAVTVVSIPPRGCFTDDDENTLGATFVTTSQEDWGSAAPAAQELRSASIDDLPLIVQPQPDSLIRIVYARTSCLPAGGVNPCVYLPSSLPRAGEHLGVTFSTRCGGNAPEALCWMIQSFRPAMPIDFSWFGTPGCWLLVNLENVITVPTTPAVNMRIGGNVYHSWTPNVTHVGAHYWLQLIVLAPGENFAGLLASPAVEIVIGAPR